MLHLIDFFYSVALGKFSNSFLAITIFSVNLLSNRPEKLQATSQFQSRPCPGSRLKSTE